MSDTSGTLCRETAYALVTAAFNEERYIERALSSIVGQTIRPARWIVVSDGSTDRTDELVQKYAGQFDFIRLHRITEQHERNFAAQVNAINTGFAGLRDGNYAFIGNLDADISLEPAYFARLLAKFGGRPRLGLAGGFIYEERGGVFMPRPSNSVNSVPHGVQLFRRSCFELLRGYLALPYGGPDWHAEVSARMNGWEVEAFPDLPAFHHRPTGTASGLLRYWYRQGFMDHSLGSHPVFEIVKLARRVPMRPYALGALARLSGFVSAHCRSESRMVSNEFVAFLRNEQVTRLKRALF